VRNRRGGGSGRKAGGNTTGGQHRFNGAPGWPLEPLRPSGSSWAAAPRCGRRDIDHPDLAPERPATIGASPPRRCPFGAAHLRRARSSSGAAPRRHWLGYGGDARTAGHRRTGRFGTMWPAGAGGDLGRRPRPGICLSCAPLLVPATGFAGSPAPATGPARMQRQVATARGLARG
jgi:hypothetical protein